jgi:hypothetical protein
MAESDRKSAAGINSSSQLANYIAAGSRIVLSNPERDHPLHAATP